MPADSMSSEDPLPGLQMAGFLLCPHMARGGGGRGRERERERERERGRESACKLTNVLALWFLLIRASIPPWGLHSHDLI